MTALSERPPRKVNGLGIDIVPESIVPESEKSLKEKNWRVIQRGSIEDIAGLFQRLIQNAQSQIGGRQVGTYELYKSIAGQLPENFEVHENQQQSALKAALDSDPNISQAGKEAFFLLKIKTILSSVDGFYLEGIDSRDDRDDMVQTGLLSLTERLSSIDPTQPISEQVSYIVRAGVLEWVAGKEGVPAEWIRNVDDRRNIAEILDELSEGHTRAITNDQIKKIIGDERLSHITVSSLADYIRRLISEAEHGGDTDTSTGEDSVFELTARVLLEEQIEGVLKTLPHREERVVRRKFGILESQELLENGGHPTRKDTAERNMGLSSKTVSREFRKAMRKLRQPIRMRGLRGYLQRSSRIREIEDLYKIDSLNLNEGLKSGLKIFGIFYVEDFLQKEPQELMEAWMKAGNDPKDLIVGIGEAFFNSLSLTSVFEALHLNVELDPEFLRRIVNKMLPRKDISDLLEDLRISGIPEREKRREIFKYGFRRLGEFYFAWRNLQKKHLTP